MVEGLNHPGNQKRLNIMEGFTFLTSDPSIHASPKPGCFGNDVAFAILLLALLFLSFPLWTRGRSLSYAGRLRMASPVAAHIGDVPQPFAEIPSSQSPFTADNASHPLGPILHRDADKPGPQEGALPTRFDCKWLTRALTKKPALKVAMPVLCDRSHRPNRAAAPHSNLSTFLTDRTYSTSFPPTRP
ncbi:hypothetical protein B0T24DRAFT_598076 [Lasiosphaeria ovina]|uniref:Uncharacterized protein n=1 Tax=Lasiosphaeria ovina TaxID=92902 RepID=A0AAE0JW03_9PEZI|nr:hypothetical protein B0T24DRAFT_598076 [Lasiosphaeria ovina]